MALIKKSISNALVLLSSVTMTINCLAIDSTHVKQNNIVAMNPNVTLTGCEATDKLPYIVTITNPTPAFPACPPNKVVKEINFETKPYFLEVTTYVSVVCCNQQIGWQAASVQPIIPG